MTNDDTLKACVRMFQEMDFINQFHMNMEVRHNMVYVCRESSFLIKECERGMKLYHYLLKKYGVKT